MTGSGGQSPAEQHLGDRLAALVDGELGHDSRERVLAHLATCGKCKAEADAQRRLKSVFAETAPPPPSEGFLARLHSLPGGGPGDDRGEPPFGGPGRDGALGAMGETLTLLPGIAPQPRERGFRIHEVERPGPRGRRFAFAAAGAVSLAAFALGGALPLEAAMGSPSARSDAPGTTSFGTLNTDGTRRDIGLAAASRDRSAVFSTPGERPGSGFPTATTHARPPMGPFVAGPRPGSTVPPLVRPAMTVGEPVPGPADVPAPAQAPPAPPPPDAATRLVTANAASALTSHR
ncbi:zf-HC2 domain-containing protein [Streptomyces varsoviensis]|nr:zf-HC2 domain-containing protein [Streptomyces varsoviensis]